MEVPKYGYDERFDYRVDILRRRNLVTATARDGTVLAQSKRALLVDEQNHGLVFYFPKGDVDIAKLRSIPERTSRCPWKGEATYWGLAGHDGDPVAWAYETPFSEISQLAGHIAFYQDRITVSIGVAENLHAGG